MCVMNIASLDDEEGPGMVDTGFGGLALLLAAASSAERDLLMARGIKNACESVDPELIRPRLGMGTFIKGLKVVSTKEISTSATAKITSIGEARRK